MNVTKIIATSACVIFFGAGIAACAGTSTPVTRPAAPAVAQTPVAVQQPPTAREIAAKLGGERFNGFDTLKPGDPMQLYGMVSGGSFWIATQKYGVNTFTTKAGRDAWIKLAQKLGCNPKWETDTSVVYPSLQP